jgi:NCAIR mutase (PurE)-related protein
LNNKEVVLDFDRTNRTGLAEAVFCTNKSPSQLETICDLLQQQNKPMLFTRLDEEAFQRLDDKFPDFLDYDPVSKTAWRGKPKQLYSESMLSIITGGSSDVPVAREASRTLQFYGHPVEEINDVGVAGLWRLTERLDEIREKKVVICIAGMDAALPTVLGGLVPGLIIAVPSSVGYGMAKQGETALQALLCSCAPGLVVVNIDNGYGAATAAIRAINNMLA